MGVEQLQAHHDANRPKLRDQILEGNLQTPTCKRCVEIRKETGGVRLLGIPTVIDRMIQQAIQQVLSPIYDPDFSDRSYGFRGGAQRTSGC